MSASAILIAQPRDVASALSSAGEYPSDKVVVKFKAVGSAPSLARGVAKISSTQTFHTVIWYLRKRLKLQDTDSVFCYVNDSFAPSLDEIVGNLHSCFKDSSGQLVISYAMNPAFG
ncbi:Ubiquitin-like protein [Colletotrichum sp. CLE4]